MRHITYSEWRQLHGRYLELINEVECCTVCNGTGNGSGTPCTSCVGMGFLDIDPVTGEPSPTEKLSVRQYANVMLAEVKQWCDFTGDDPVDVMNEICEGKCPLPASEILFDMYPERYTCY